MAHVGCNSYIYPTPSIGSIPTMLYFLLQETVFRPKLYFVGLGNTSFPGVAKHCLLWFLATSTFEDAETSQFNGHDGGRDKSGEGTYLPVTGKMTSRNWLCLESNKK